MDLRLANKVVVVTGAGRGMGVEIALAFAGGGANLLVHYHNFAQGATETVRSAQGLGVKAIALRPDVTKSGEVAQFFEQIKERFSTADVLVNNAGLVVPGAVSSYSDENWRLQIGSQLDGTFYCTREALKIMIKKKAGKIINNISSGSVCSPSF